MLQFKCYNGQIDDVWYVVTHARSGDIVSTDSVEERVEKSKELWVAYEDKEPIAIFGITDFFKFRSYDNMIYFIGTDKVTNHKKTFVKVGRRVIEKWLEDYGSLYFNVLWTYEMGLRMVKAFKFKLLMDIGDFGLFVREW